MLLLKLMIVPAFIVLITLAARRWGPQIAGLMAGFPVVTWPILLFISIEQGHAFASRAAASSVSAVTAAVAFGILYAWTSRSLAWWWSLLIALTGWTLVAYASAQLQPSLSVATAMTLGALLLAPRILPDAADSGTATPTGMTELLARMLAAAILVGLVTTTATSLGTRWSGLLAMFPVLASVLCVFSHRSYGPAYVTKLLRGMIMGYYSFAAFCVGLALVVALTLQLGMQGAKRLAERASGSATTDAA